MGETTPAWRASTRRWPRPSEEQFLPEAAGGDRCRRPCPGALLATAEKIDNMVARLRVRRAPVGLEGPLRPAPRRDGHGDHRLRARLRPTTCATSVAARLRPARALPAPGRPARPWWRRPSTSSCDRLAKCLADDGVARDGRGRGAARLGACSPTCAAGARGPGRLPGRRRRGTTCVTVFTRPANLAKKLPPEAEGAAVDPALFAERGRGRAVRGVGGGAGRVDRRTAHGRLRCGAGGAGGPAAAASTASSRTCWSWRTTRASAARRCVLVRTRRGSARPGGGLRTS